MGTLIIVVTIIVGFAFVASRIGVNPQSKTDDQLQILHDLSKQSGASGACDRENIEEEMIRRGLLDSGHSAARTPVDASHTDQLRAAKLRKSARDAFEEGLKMGNQRWPGEERKIQQHALTTVLLRRLQAEPGAPAVSEELINALNFEAIPFIPLELGISRDTICEYIVWREYPTLANEDLINNAVSKVRERGFIEGVLNGSTKGFSEAIPWGKLLVRDT